MHIGVMPDRSSKRPTDPNQLTKLVTKVATGQANDPMVDPTTGKNVAAVALGRRGGMKGGVARAKMLSAERRSEIAKKAALTRWKSHSNE